MAKRRRSGFRARFTKRSRAARGGMGMIGSVAMAGALGAGAYLAANYLGNFVPVGLSASLKAALILVLAYVMGFRHSAVKAGLTFAVAITAYSFLNRALAGGLTQSVQAGF